MKHTRHRHVHSGVEDYWKSLWSCPLWSQALFHLAETKPSDSPVPGCVCHSELEERKDVRAEVTDKLWAPRLAAVSDKPTRIQDYGHVALKALKQGNSMIRILFQNDCSDDCAD